ncbi:MAG: 4Fe-4S dicluster domain-containing protein [Promethearchaeota archaeon]
MPKLIENKEKHFVLFLNKNRCGGCESCVTLCPTGILEMSDELNMRVSFIPKVKEGKEKYCTACRRCEFGCPDWAIYILDESQLSSVEAKKAKT